MENTNQPPSISLQEYLQTAEITDPYQGLTLFFDAETLPQVRTHLGNLRETLLTESYGELEPDDKWLLYQFLNRLDVLVESSYKLQQAHICQH